LAVISGRPRSAPGPSDQLIEQEERARRDALFARRQLTEASAGEVAGAEKKLAEALKALAKVEETLRAAERDLESYPVPGYLEGAYATGKLMVAVTGASGVGKSSFINAVRRMRPKDRGAAKTGVTETTLEPSMFSLPGRQAIFRRSFSDLFDADRSEAGRSVGRSLLARNEPRRGQALEVGDRVLIRGQGPSPDDQIAEVVAVHDGSSLDVALADGTIVSVVDGQVKGTLAECVIWDLPGVGTPAYPQSTYIKEMGIRYFDIVVLMTATRFTEAELKLVQELKRWQVPFFLVRNKADSDVRAEIEAEEDIEGDSLSEERQKEVEREVLQAIKNYFLRDFGLHPVYCIASRIRRVKQFDFELLERDLQECLKSL